MRFPASYRLSEHSLALTICQSFNKFKRILGVSCFSFMKSCCLVVQFSKSFDRPFCGGPYIISLPLPPCQPPFFIFFNFFSRAPESPRIGCRRAAKHCIPPFISDLPLTQSAEECSFGIDFNYSLKTRRMVRKCK